MSVDLSSVMGAVAQPIVDRVRTWLPGEVVSFDRRTRRAVVKANARMLVTGDDSSEEERAIPDADMPVQFFRCGGFTLVADLKKGNTGKIHYTCMPLDSWKSDGKVYAVRMGRFALGDAEFEPGLSDYGHAGIEIPPDTMILGMEDGGRILFEKTGQVLTISSINEVRVLGGALVRIESRGDVVLQGRRVSPLGGEI